jgi:hypothetical protein
MGLVTILYCLRFETSFFIASFFIASYDSQGYGGGIQPCPLADPCYKASAWIPQITPLPPVLLLHEIAVSTDRAENTASHSYSFVAFVSVLVIT